LLKEGDGSHEEQSEKQEGSIKPKEAEIEGGMYNSLKFCIIVLILLS